MTEEELYKELGVLTRNKERWKENIPSVAALLEHNTIKIPNRVVRIHCQGAIKATTN